MTTPRLQLELQPAGITARYAGQSARIAATATRDESLSALVDLTALPQVEIERQMFEASLALVRKLRANSAWYASVTASLDRRAGTFRTFREVLRDEGFEDGLVCTPEELAAAQLTTWLSGAQYEDMLAADQATPLPTDLKWNTLEEWCGPAPEVEVA